MIGDFDPWGALYIVRCKGLYKIGQTRQRVIDRIRMLQAGNPGKLQIVCAIPVIDPVRTEREVHKTLRDYRMRGEWFLLSKHDIQIFKAAERVAKQEYEAWKNRVNYFTP